MLSPIQSDRETWLIDVAATTPLRDGANARTDEDVMHTTQAQAVHQRSRRLTRRRHIDLGRYRSDLCRLA